MAYEGMKKLYLNNQYNGLFHMAVSYIMDKGFTFVSEIEDKDVESIEGNGLMTKEYVQDLVNLAREIVKECNNNLVEIIQFCMAEELFEYKMYAGIDDENDWEDDI